MYFNVKVSHYNFRRYLYFAQRADIEGYNDVASVFRSTAEGETGHAHGHLEFLQEVTEPIVTYHVTAEFAVPKFEWVLVCLKGASFI